MGKYLGILLLVFSPFVKADLYIGAGGGYSYIDWKEGSELLDGAGYQISPFIGYWLDESFAVEFGFSYGKSKRNTAQFNQGDSLFGRSIPSHQETHQASTNIKEFHLDGLMYSDYFMSDARVFAIAGLGIIKPEIEHTHLSSVTVPGLPEAVINNREKLTSNWKPVARLGAGFQYDWTDEWAVRISGVYQIGSNITLKDKIGEQQSKINKGITGILSVIYQL